MPRPDPQRDRRRQTFLRLLAAGEPAIGAADAADIPRSTLYIWRRDAPRFRAAWDRAAVLAREALADRFQAALIHRAVDGVDEPVFHAGKLVGTRKRYSDALLLAGLREMIKPQAAERGAAQAQPKVQVVIREFDHYDPAPPAPIAAPVPYPAISCESAAPESTTSEPAAPPVLPDPASAPALRWDRLNQRDGDGPW